MKNFLIGFAVASLIWLYLISTIQIPEYTVITKCLTV